MSDHPLRGGAAGAVAALIWAAQEPLDQRIFRCDYSDVALLGKGITRGRSLRTAGLLIPAINGALFGIAFNRARGRMPIRPQRLALTMAEHVALYPLSWFVDRYHPARGAEGIPPLLRNWRAFAQATWRHALFGLLLSRLDAGPGMFASRPSPTLRPSPSAVPLKGVQTFGRRRLGAGPWSVALPSPAADRCSARPFLPSSSGPSRSQPGHQRQQAVFSHLDQASAVSAAEGDPGRSGSTLSACRNACSAASRSPRAAASSWLAATSRRAAEASFSSAVRRSSAAFSR